MSIYFLVSLAVFISVSGWLGDRFGGKRVLLTAIVLFTVASALCGLATSLTELEIFRVLQGVGGGMMAPVGLAMLFRAFPPAERIRASAILTVPTTLAPAARAGARRAAGHRAVLALGVLRQRAAGRAALAFGVLFLASGNARPAGAVRHCSGSSWPAPGLGLLMYGVSEGPIRSWDSGVVLGTISAGAVLLGLLVLVELRRPGR